MSIVKDKILTVKDVAKLLLVHSEHILAAIKNGDLKAAYFRGEWHIRESSYLEYEKKFHQENNQRFITIGQASSIIKISQTIILRAVQKGIIKTRSYKHSFKISLESLLEWDRKNFARDR